MHAKPPAGLAANAAAAAGAEGRKEENGGTVEWREGYGRN